MHKSDSVWKWGGKESQDDKIKKSQTNPDTQWYYLLRGKSSINSLAFIFLGYCSIQWIQPAQEKKNKEQVNKHRAPSIPRRCCGRMRQRPKAVMLFSKTQYSLFTFQQGPLLSDTHSVVIVLYPPCWEEIIWREQRPIFFFFKWAAVTKQHISHLKQQRWYTNLITYPVIWLRRKGFDTLTIRRSALYAGRRSSGYSIRVQDKSLDWDT